MTKYRGFVGQVAPLSGLGLTRDSYKFQYNGERDPYRGTITTNKISPPSYLVDQPVSPAEQEVTAPQYPEGGLPDTRLETDAKIDEAYTRIKEADRWAGVMGIHHPDDLASKTPIYCMKTNPNIRTFVALSCKPNQAAIDEMAARGLKTTLPTTRPPVTPEQKPNLLPLAIGAGLIWLMS